MTKCSSLVFLGSLFKHLEITASVTDSSKWCKASPACVIRNLSAPLSVPVPLTLFHCCTTVIMKGISMSFGSEDLPVLCSPKPICHAYFIQAACITCDHTLISYFPNLFCEFSSFMKLQLPKHVLNIHTSRDNPDYSLRSSRLRLN